MNNLKSYITPQILVYTIIGVGLAGYMFYLFFSSNEKVSDKDSAISITGEGKILVKNEKPLGKDFFEGYRERNNERASLDLTRFNEAAENVNEDEKIKNSDTENNTFSFEENTDDEDLKKIQQALREQNKAKKPAISINKPLNAIPKQKKELFVPLVEKKDTIEQSIKDSPKNRFFEGRRRSKIGNTFACVVHGDQEVMSGSTLKLRLLDDYITLEGKTIEKGTTLWGVCSLSKERMFVTIQSVLIDKNLLSINLEAFDLDGLKGVNLSNNVKAEIAKRAKADVLRQTQTDDILGNEGILKKGANTVINATKNILSKKQEEIKIPMKSNYQLVLKTIIK